MGSPLQQSSTLLELYSAVQYGQAKLLQTLHSILGGESIDIVEASKASLALRVEKAETDYFPFILESEAALLPFSEEGKACAYLQVIYSSAKIARQEILSAINENLTPHLQQALSLCYKIKQQQEDIHAVHYVLDHYPMPMIALDQHLQTIFCNRAAHHYSEQLAKRLSASPQKHDTKKHDAKKHNVSDLVIRARETLPITSLCSSDVEKQRIKTTLLAQMHDALNGDVLTVGKLGKVESPVIFFSTSMIPSVLRHYQRDAMTWVFLLDGTFEPFIKHHPAFSQFNLTKAETQLCISLLEGKSLSIIAEQRNVSIQTIRKQLQSVLRKTNCSSQEHLLLQLFKQCIGSTLFE